MLNIWHNPVTLKCRMLSVSICEGHRNRNKGDESGLPLETSARTGARGLRGPRRVLRNTNVCLMVHFNIIRTRSHNTCTHAYTNTTTKGLPSVDEQKLLLLPSSTLQRYRSDWLDSNLLVTLPRLALLPAVDAHLRPWISAQHSLPPCFSKWDDVMCCMLQTAAAALPNMASGEQQAPSGEEKESEKEWNAGLYDCHRDCKTCECTEAKCPSSIACTCYQKAHHTINQWATFLFMYMSREV